MKHRMGSGRRRLGEPRRQAFRSLLRVAGLLPLVAGALSGVPGYAEEPDKATIVVRRAQGVRADAGRPELPSVPGRLVWTGTDGDGRHEQAIEVPGEATVGVKPGSWIVRLSAEGYWARTGVIDVIAGSSARLEVFPTGTLTGKLSIPKGEPAPEMLTVRFESSNPERARIPRTQVECPVENKIWSCEIPAAGELDLRLRARGFVSHHLWNVRLPTRGTIDLGRLALRRGASLAGWMKAGVTIDEDIDLAEHGKVTLRPAPAGVGLQTSQIERMELEIRPSRRGFFHFEGVPPGNYVVSATLPGLASAELFPVQVMENAETELRDPLELFPPLALELRIEPPADLFGRPWSVALIQVTEIPGSGEHLGEARADDQGYFVRKPLSAGSYLVVVQDSLGSRMAMEQIQLTESSGPFELELPVVWIEGTVSIDDEPLAAGLWFGGRFGSQSVHFESDDEGSFVGYLPREGDWPVYVESDDLDIRRTVEVSITERSDGRPTQVELELPDTRISGRVVDTAGDPLADVLVKLKQEDVDETVDVTDKSGRFGFRGVAEGSVRLFGESRDGSTETRLIQVSETMDSTGLELVLRRARAVVGRVVGPGGPVPGASVWLNAADGVGRPVPDLSSSRGATDVEGRFELYVAESAEKIRPVVFPPGFGLKILPSMAVPEQPLAVEVESVVGLVTLELGRPVTWGDIEREPKPALLWNGEAVSFWVLEHWRRAYGGAPLTDGDLTYRLSAMPPGTYRACWVAPMETTSSAFGVDCSEGRLAPGGDLTLTLP